MKKPRSIRELFSFPGFVAKAKLQGVLGDRFARVVVLQRRKKQRYALAVDTDAEVDTTNARVECETFLSQVGASTLSLSAGGYTAPGAEPCL